jgi:hypothetical protein
MSSITFRVLRFCMQASTCNRLRSKYEERKIIKYLKKKVVATI